MTVVVRHVTRLVAALLMAATFVAAMARAQSTQPGSPTSALTLGTSTIRGVISGLKPADLRRVRVSVRRGGTSLSNIGVDEKGTYAVTGVPSGVIEVVAEVAMRRQLSTTVNVQDDSAVTVNLQFPPGVRLSGRVTQQGKALARTWVQPRPTSQHDVFMYGASTSANGEYLIEDLPPGDYHVGLDGYTSRLIKVTSDTVFNIDVPAAQVSGRVAEVDGRIPIIEVDIEIWSVRAGSPRMRVIERTDQSGRFDLAGLEPGEYILTAYKPGYEMFRRTLSYKTPIPSMNITLRQNPGVEMSIRDAHTGESVQQVYIIEMLDDRDGTRLFLPLNEYGIGNIPRALTGSTLWIYAFGYEPTMIRDWPGRTADIELIPQIVQ